MRGGDTHLCALLSTSPGSLYTASVPIMRSQMIHELDLLTVDQSPLIDLDSLILTLTPEVLSAWWRHGRRSFFEHQDEVALQILSATVLISMRPPILLSDKV